MPKAAPLNPILIRSIFDYDPATGALIPKPTAKNAARRINSTQWEIGTTKYSMHRLVWAWHHPDDPTGANPVYLTHKDGNKKDHRIENLTASNVHPRWKGHIKQRKAAFDVHGKITWEEIEDYKYDFQ